MTFHTRGSNWRRATDGIDFSVRPTGPTHLLGGIVDAAFERADAADPDVRAVDVALSDPNFSNGQLEPIARIDQSTLSLLAPGACWILMF